jgi:hypothetical protein
LAEKISRFGLSDALLKYNSKPLEKEAKSIVAGLFLQFLKGLFRIQILSGDIMQFESGK